MSEIECPYCNAKKKIEQEGRYCAENIIHEIKCEHCEKNFVFTTETLFKYYPRKANCVNGSPHQLTNWVTLWVISNSQKVQSRRCRDCEYREQKTMIDNKEDVKGVVGLERRGHNGAGTLIPLDTCPIWGDTTKPRRTIIGIVGPKNSGKSEAAKYIADNKGYTVKSIATPIKQILSIIGIPHKNLFGTNEDKNELLTGFNTTARKLLQYTGTEFGRDSLHKDVWIDILIKNLDPNTSYVIDDVRFINEAEKIKALGGILIGLSRPWMSWEDQGVDNHTSEICAYAEPFKSMIDHWVGNNGTKEELHNNIAKIVNVK